MNYWYHFSVRKKTVKSGHDHQFCFTNTATFASRKSTAFDYINFLPPALGTWGRGHTVFTARRRN
jgi:hypothetical protein